MTLAATEVAEKYYWQEGTSCIPFLLFFSGNANNLVMQMHILKKQTPTLTTNKQTHTHTWLKTTTLASTPSQYITVVPVYSSLVYTSD